MILVLEAPARQDAAAVLDGLPLVVGKVIEFDLIELHPFSALGMLFAGAGRS